MYMKIHDLKGLEFKQLEVGVKYKVYCSGDVVVTEGANTVAPIVPPTLEALEMTLIEARCSQIWKGLANRQASAYELVFNTRTYQYILAVVIADNSGESFTDHIAAICPRYTL